MTINFTKTRIGVGLLALMLVGLYLVTAYAIVGPGTIADDGAATPAAPKDFEPTDEGFVQVIKIDDDADGDNYTVGVELVRIRNAAAGTLAGPTDIEKIEIYSDTANDCVTAPVLQGTTTNIAAFNTAGGVDITLTNFVVPDNGTVYMCVKIKTLAGQTAGRNVKTEVTRMEGREPASPTGGWWFFTGAATAPNTHVTKASGFKNVADNSLAAGNIDSGGTRIVQIILVEDGVAAPPPTDANGSAVNVTSVTINNLGNATLPDDVTKIEVLNCGISDTCAGVPPVMGTATGPFVANFPIVVPTPANNAFVDESTTQYIGIRITASSTVGRKFQLSTTLTTNENSQTNVTANIDVPLAKETTISGPGCEVLQNAAGIGPATIPAGTIGFNAGDNRGLVQIIRCSDNDGGSTYVNITVNSVTVSNLGSAVVGDIGRIALYRCTNATCGVGGGEITAGNLMGSLVPAALPATVTATANNVLLDEAVSYIGIVVDVTSTIGNTIQTQAAVNLTEGSVTVNQGPVDDDTLSTIIAAWVDGGCDILDDLNYAGGTIASGTSAVVQRMRCVDSDDNDTNAAQITNFNVRNLGTANNTDVSTVEILDGFGNVLGSSSNTANFATTGVNIPVAITIPDEGSMILQVQVFVTSTPGRTIRPTSTLQMFEGGFFFSKAATDGTAETIGGGPVGGCTNVTLTVRPTSVRFTADAQYRTIRLSVRNRSGAPIDVTDIDEVAGEIFNVDTVRPALPRTIRNNRAQTFFVRVQETNALVFPATATPPYFDVTMNCGLATANAPLVPQGRMTLESLQAQSDGRRITLKANGQGIESVQLQLFNLSGNAVLTAQNVGRVLVAEARNDEGHPLANGVYLYVVTIKGWDGTELRSEVRKLVILR